MKNRLTSKELTSLMHSVFSIRSTDEKVMILIDLPDESRPDNPKWSSRRSVAYNWYRGLNDIKSSLGLSEIHLTAYPNIHSNNADLPENVFNLDSLPENFTADDLLKKGSLQNLKNCLKSHQIIFALTEFSATAPLKLLAKDIGFRAATMPGFSEDMIPALRLDYDEINRRVNIIKKELDESNGLRIDFTVRENKKFDIYFDLTNRTAHASGGRFPDPGTAGNLPSGESYIVPYEGELKPESRSSGILPVQFENEVVLYRIEKNKAVEILSQGPFSEIEKKLIYDEPAYSNISELGFGVLKDFDIKPINEILIDEKLGLHIAFGRSDHFGGAVGVADFSSPEKVVHIDRIYLPETQPLVYVDQVTLFKDNGTEKILMKNNKYNKLF